MAVELGAVEGAGAEDKRIEVKEEVVVMEQGEEEEEEEEGKNKRSED